MKIKNLSMIGFAIGLCVLVLTLEPSSQKVHAEESRNLVGKMLTGTIRSSDNKPLEGVTISARDSVKTITTSVFTDEKGDFSFPALDKGQYRVWAQAVGFEMGKAQVMLDPAKPTRQDFTLKATSDFEKQLSGVEWMQALPGDKFEDRRMKEIFFHNCTQCHTPGAVLQNRFDKAGWLAILTAMERANSGTVGVLKEVLPNIRHFREELAEYLAKVRGPGPSPMKFQPLPRPSGESTKVVITEYDVPPALTPDELHITNGSDWSEGTPSTFQQRQSHDATVDFDGNGWVAASGPNRVRTYAKIDAKTGKVTNYKVPGKNGWVRTSHEIMTGPDGTLWLTVSADAGSDAGSIGKVDPKTGKIQIFDPPAGMTPVSAGGGHLDVDGKGKVWTVTRKGGIRLDPDTGKFTDFISLSVDNPKFSTYGLAADSEGNGWWAILTEDKVGMSDIKTGKSREIQYPPRSEKREYTTLEDRKFYDRTDNLTLSNNTSNVGARTPRRMASDYTGHYIYSSDYFGADIGRIDIKTLKLDFFDVPIAYGSAYDVHVDANHMLWASFKPADRVGKLNPDTGKWIVYQLPGHGNECENIFADKKTGDVWLAAGRTSKAIRLQFRTE